MEDDLFGVEDSLNKTLWKGREGVFTLYDAELNNGYLYPKYVVKGECEFDNFDGFSLRISDFSDWFDGFKYFEVEDGYIRKDISKSKIDEVVRSNGNDKVRFFTDYHYEIKTSKKDVDTTSVSEYFTINVDYLDGSRGLGNVKHDVSGVRILFSLLMGVVASMISCAVVKAGKSFEIYFGAGGELDVERNIRAERICWSQQFVANDGWGKLLGRYYGEEVGSRFEKIWRRLFGLMIYDGFWDFKILGSVAIIDAYSDQVKKDIRVKVGKATFSKLKDRLVDIVEQEKEKCGDRYEAFDAIKKHIGELRNTSLPTFKERYTELMRQHKDIASIIDLTDEDFDHIKAIRDSVAHGEQPKTKDSYDLTYEITLQNKLLVLAFYFCYKDLGVADNEFASFLSNSHNKIIRSADVNKLALDKLKGTVLFVDVSKDVFDSAVEGSFFQNVLRYQINTEEYLFDGEATLKVKRGWVGSLNKFKNLESYVASVVGDDVEKIAYIGSVYVCCDDDAHELVGACIIDPPSNIESYIDRIYYVDVDVDVDVDVEC